MCFFQFALIETKGRSNSLLSDCLSEASRHHERDASRDISPASSSRSCSSRLRNQSPFCPESPFHCTHPEFYEQETASLEKPIRHETTSLSQIDMWHTTVPGSRLVSDSHISQAVPYLVESRFTGHLLNVPATAPFSQAVTPKADGLYHCQREGLDDCQHKPDKLMCNYEYAPFQFVSHLVSFMLTTVFVPEDLSTTI